MSVISRIYASTRGLVGDLSTTHNGDSFLIATAGSSTIIQLSKLNPIAITSVTKNGTVVSSGSYSLSGNLLTLTTTLSVNDTIIVKYTYYPMYSNTELKEYVRASLSYISVAGVKDFTLDEVTTDEITPIPTEREEQLIALVTSILIKPLQTSYRSSIISISYPEKMSKDEKIEKAIWKYGYDRVGRW